MLEGFGWWSWTRTATRLVVFRHWRLFVQVSVHVFVDVVLLVALGAVTVFSMVMILMAVSSMVMVVGRTLFKRLLLLSLQIYNY